MDQSCRCGSAPHGMSLPAWPAPLPLPPPAALCSARSRFFKSLPPQVVENLRAKPYAMENHGHGALCALCLLRCCARCICCARSPLQPNEGISTVLSIFTGCITKHITACAR